MGNFREKSVHIALALALALAIAIAMAMAMALTPVFLDHLRESGSCAFDMLRSSFFVLWFWRTITLHDHAHARAAHE